MRHATLTALSLWPAHFQSPEPRRAFTSSSDDVLRFRRLYRHMIGYFGQTAALPWRVRGLARTGRGRIRHFFQASLSTLGHDENIFLRGNLTISNYVNSMDYSIQFVINHCHSSNYYSIINARTVIMIPGGPTPRPGLETQSNQSWLIISTPPSCSA